MQGVVLAAGEGTRLRPLTEDKPKALVEVDGRPILGHCFDRLIELDAEELLVVVGYQKQKIIEHYGDTYEGVPITYAHHREPKGLAHALLTVEEHVDGDFMLILGDNVFEANLGDVVNRQQEDRADAAFLVEEVPWEEARSSCWRLTTSARLASKTLSPSMSMKSPSTCSSTVRSAWASPFGSRWWA